MKKEIPGHRREDMYDILEGERKAQRDQEEEEEEEDEDEEEEAPRRKPPVGFEGIYFIFDLKNIKKL